MTNGMVQHQNVLPGWSHYITLPLHVLFIGNYVAHDLMVNTKPHLASYRVQHYELCKFSYIRSLQLHTTPPSWTRYFASPKLMQLVTQVMLDIFFAIYELTKFEKAYNLSILPSRALHLGWRNLMGYCYALFILDTTSLYFQLFWIEKIYKFLICLLATRIAHRI